MKTHTLEEDQSIEFNLADRKRKWNSSHHSFYRFHLFHELNDDAVSMYGSS